MRIVIGVDPGKTGAIACLNGSNLIWAVRMPLIKSTRELDSKKIFELIEKSGAEAVFQERVSSRPDNGVKQAFEFGRCAEVCRTIALVQDIPFILVEPKKWQSLIPNCSGKNTKEAAVKFVKKRWPTVPIKFKLDWGMADAVSIAHFGLQQS